MRASTLFALTLAVLVGLGVAIAAKLSGFFSPPAPAPTPAVKKAEVMVLAAARNLFAGDMLDPNGVRVRALRADELADYQKNKDNYLPPVPNAAFLRIARQNIEADRPILKSCLKELAKPEPLSQRLLPQMRAVNLVLAKDRSAGGMISVGDWVDVFVTCNVEGRNGATSTRTACLVAHVRVVAKRNTLWPVYAPLPETKPVQYTLEVNPYRAALIDFISSRGQFLLSPLPLSEAKRLEAERTQALDTREGVVRVHFLNAADPEAREEEGRVGAFLRGDLAVGEVDMMRIFGLNTDAPPRSPIVIERLTALDHLDPVRFTATGERIITDRYHTAASAARPGVHQGAAFRFSSPDTKCTPGKG